MLLLHPLWWCCVECVIHLPQDVRKEQQYIHVARKSNNKVILARDLYCCLLPQCKALRAWSSGFLIATKRCCDQDVEVVPCEALTKTTCDWCGSL